MPRRCFGRGGAQAETAATMTTTTTKKSEAKPAAPKPVVPNGPHLSQLAGMPEARAWGEALAADIDLYKRGMLEWSEIDPGLVLYGPPGTGKTTLARAFAATAGLPLIGTSYSEWSRGNHYGIDVQNAILATFDTARKNAPCVVAIDEIDSFPQRSALSENQQATYAIINTLLDQLDGLNRRPGVVVIGTCNNRNRLDPALVRAGRLGRLIEVPLPDLEDLPKIIAFHLKDDAASFGDLSGIAVMCVGMSGAAVEQLVRDARGHARRQGRKLQKTDLINRLQARAKGRHPEMDWRIAVHEAGHAVAAYRIFKATNIALSIVPSPERQGQARYNLPSVPLTQTVVIAKLILFLAGRAAEEIFLRNVSAGAGGREDSDLAMASNLALDAVASYGLSSSGSLFWHRPAGDSVARSPQPLKDEADKLVRKAYNMAKVLIGREWDFVNLAATELIRHRAIAHRQFVRCDRRPDPLRRWAQDYCANSNR
jgi:ATP-dependent Zn protease